MATGMLGADTDALRRLAERFDASAEDVEDAVDAAVRAIAEVDWRGADADAFRSDAVHAIRSLGAALADRAVRSADALCRQADAQDEASAADGSPAFEALAGPGAPGASGTASLDPAAIAPLLFADPFADGFDPVDWVMGTASEAARWTWDHLGVPVVNALASVAHAASENPGASLSVAAGLALMGAGMAGDGLGLALMPTGLVTFGAGTAAGAAVVVGSSALIAVGAGIAGLGGMALLNEAVQNPQSPASASAPRTYRPPGPSGGQPPRPVSDVFDELPWGTNERIRMVRNDAELKATYDALARGGEVFRRPGYPGEWVRQPDGTEIGLRTTSKSGGRTIDIRMPDGTTRKVHRS